MKKFESANIKNLAIIGGKGVGKTTFLESILFTTKVTGRQGSVAERNSNLDVDPLEIERQQTLTSKLVPVEWKSTKINFLDTPGYSDFWGDTVGAISAADIALIVVDAGSGADIATGRLLSYVENSNKPLAFVMNKMNTERADWKKAYSTIKDKLRGAVMFHLPIGQSTDFSGMIDLFEMKAYTYRNGKLESSAVPDNLANEAKEQRTALIEAAAESDESLLEKYLNSGELSEDEIKMAVKKGIINKSVIPIFVSAADGSVGTEPLLNSLINHFPSPLDMPALKVKDGSGNEVEVKADPSGVPLAQVFKVTSDPGIGDVFFFRVWSGILESGGDVYNSTKSGSERLGHLMIIRGKVREEIESAPAGDMAAVAKLKQTEINDTLCAKAKVMLMTPISFPEPVVPLAIKPKTKKDQDRMGVALSKIVATDPTLKYHVDREFSETIATGMGEVHIETMVQRLKERYDVDIEVGKPHIPYRETVTRKCEKQGKYKKQTGGHGQYGDCWLRIEPLPSGSGFVFENEIVGGSIPGKYIPAVEKGVRDAMQKGVVAGYPVVDIKVTVFDGSYHEVDSSDLAFQIAGSMAFKGAMEESRPELLEPFVILEVFVPQENMGDISSDISSRRGRVKSMEHGVVKAEVPMAEIYQYSASLRSITSGAGTYLVKFSHYESVPSHIAQKIVDESKREKEQAEKA